jgi:hypothetical protein
MSSEQLEQVLKNPKEVVRIVEEAIKQNVKLDTI